MGFCEHCAGQRFDRAQVLRALRAARRNLPRRGRASQADAALAASIFHFGEYTIQETKRIMAERGISVRLAA